MNDFLRPIFHLKNNEALKITLFLGFVEVRKERYKKIKYKEIQKCSRSQKPLKEVRAVHTWKPNLPALMRNSFSFNSDHLDWKELLLPVEKKNHVSA